MKKAFPKKAKLISDGGLYRIVSIKGFSATIEMPILRKITISTPEFFFEEGMKFLLKFRFDRVRRGYAEYIQFDYIKLSIPDTMNKV